MKKGCRSQQADRKEVKDSESEKARKKKKFES